VIERDVFEANVKVYDEEGITDANEEKLVLLEKHVSTLAYEQQQCIRLFFIENKTYQQISQETGLTFKQIKSFIQNGKRNLRIKLSGLAVNE
jgi:DNA-directed RNA polymerase specialized sigma24 family protein